MYKARFPAFIVLKRQVTTSAPGQTNKPYQFWKDYGTIIVNRFKRMDYGLLGGWI